MGEGWMDGGKGGIQGEQSVRQRRNVERVVGSRRFVAPDVSPGGKSTARRWQAPVEHGIRVGRTRTLTYRLN